MIANRLQWCCKFDHKRKEIDCCGEIKQRLNMLKFVSYKVGRSTLTSLYKSLTRSRTEYGDVIWDDCFDCDSSLFDSVQYEAARSVTGAI